MGAAVGRGHQGAVENLLAFGKPSFLAAWDVTPRRRAESKRRGSHACNGHRSSKGARTGVKGGQPRAGARERFRAFERDSSRWNAPRFVVARRPSREVAQTRASAVRAGRSGVPSLVPIGSRQRAHEKKSRGGDRGNPKGQTQAAFARSFSAFASCAAARQTSRGHSSCRSMRCSPLARRRSILERGCGAGERGR
jgi:hypothetical protein